MASGRTLWDELVVRYSRGVEDVEAMQRQWTALAPYVDAERHAEVTAFLRIQAREARWWRDACIAYFQTFSRRPLPEGFAAPEHALDWYRERSFPFAPGH
jgi:alpha-glucuronidase